VVIERTADMVKMFRCFDSMKVSDGIHFEVKLRFERKQYGIVENIRSNIQEIFKIIRPEKIDLRHMLYRVSQNFVNSTFEFWLTAYKKVQLFMSRAVNQLDVHPHAVFRA